MPGMNPPGTQSPLLSNGSNVPVKEEDGMSAVLESDDACSTSSNCAVKSEVRERRVEVGRFYKIKSIDVFYYYEHFPTWLLLLDALAVGTITIGGIVDMETFVAQIIVQSQCSSSFIHWIIDRIGQSKFLFTHEVEPKKEVKLLLLNGSMTFISSYLARQVPVRCLLVVDGHFTHRLRNGRPSGTHALTQVSWNRIRHQVLGGPTSYMCLIGTVHFQISIPVSALRRTIRDVWNAGVRSMGVRSADVTRALDRTWTTMSFWWTHCGGRYTTPLTCLCPDGGTDRCR